MMIGTCRAVGPRSQDAADFDAAHHRQVEIQDDEVRRLVGHGFERRVAAADDVRLGVAGAFEGVLDEAGDVLLVFDDEYAVSGHSAPLRYGAEVSSSYRSC